MQENQRLVHTIAVDQPQHDAKPRTASPGNGATTCRYVEACRSHAGEYYLGTDHTVAEYTVPTPAGETTTYRHLSPAEYEAWVDWINPDMGESMGTPGTWLGSQGLIVVRGNDDQRPQFLYSSLDKR